MSTRGLILPAGAVIVAALALHAPVVTGGKLITPAGMHHAMWPWKAALPETIAAGADLEENHTLSDLLFQVYPWQLHVTRTLGAGAIPLWNPHSYTGVPFLANAQSAVLYPLHWPVWILPSMHVYTLALLAKIVLAGVFMAWYLRGIGLSSIPCAAGAVAFALCGFMTGWLGYAHTNAAILLPLQMDAARRLARRPGANGFLLLTAAGAAQHLGGHPETSLHIVGASVIYFAWLLPRAPRPRLSIGLFAAGSVLGFTLAAAQIFPFLGYLSRSAALAARDAGPPVDPVLPWDTLLAWLLPGIYGRPEAFTWAGPAAFQAVIGYVGAGMILLALLPARRGTDAPFLRLLAAASAVVVYGPESVHRVLAWVPWIGITSNNRLLLLVAFCLVALGASSLEAILDPPIPRRTFGVRIALSTLALILCALIFSGRDPAGALWAAALVAATAALAGLALARPAMARVHLAGVAALVCLDMVFFARGFNPHARPEDLFPATPLTDFLRQDAAQEMIRGGRVMTVGWVMRPETHMVYRLHSIEGYDAVEFGDYRRLLDRARVEEIHRTGVIPEEARPLIDLLGLRYIVTPPEGSVRAEGVAIAYDGPDGRVFVNDRARPRFRFVAASRAAPADVALDLLAAGGGDPGRTVILDAPVGGEAGGAADGVTAAPNLVLERATSGLLHVHVSGHDTPGWLVIGDAWDPGWVARVNGRSARVVRADFAFRAVEIPAQEAAVTMHYRPVSFRAGIWVSALSLLVTLAVGIARWGPGEPLPGLARGTES